MNAVKLVIPADSNTVQVLSQNLFTTKVAYRSQADELSTLQTLVHRGNELLGIKKSGFLVSGEQAQNRIQKLGYAFAPTYLDLDPGSFIPENPREITLADLVAMPSNPERKNFLEYPRFNIKAPIIETVASDLYNTTSSGAIDYTSPIIEQPSAYASGNFESTPVLRKLLDGVVLLNGVPFLPEPGELGNSYIVGHGRNYANAGSPYSEIFEPLVEKSRVGEEILIWDNEGRKLTFIVFENRLIDFNDVETAYGWGSGVWDNRRIITLQTCKLEWTPAQGWYPTKRWLVRAELKI